MSKRCQSTAQCAHEHQLAGLQLHLCFLGHASPCRCPAATHCPAWEPWWASVPSEASVRASQLLTTPPLSAQHRPALRTCLNARPPHRCLARSIHPPHRQCSMQPTSSSMHVPLQEACAGTHCCPKMSLTADASSHAAPWLPRVHLSSIPHPTDAKRWLTAQAISAGEHLVLQGAQAGAHGLPQGQRQPARLLITLVLEPVPVGCSPKALTVSTVWGLHSLNNFLQ